MGRVFRVTTFGESHCAAVGVIIDGCPPLLDLQESDIQPQLTRRRPGQSILNTPRKEADVVHILSGTEMGKTLGTPIAAIVKNTNTKPTDYSFQKKGDGYIPRPSHADFSYLSKYGVHSSSGGGRSSARETISRVIAGSIAEKWLSKIYGIEIVAWVSAVNTLKYELPLSEYETITRDCVDQTIIRCPDIEMANKMIEFITKTRDDQDSCGGIITCVCRKVPIGLGEPCFDKLEAELGKAMLSIPSTKGFEIGSGFSGTEMLGSEHNDVFVKVNDTIKTKTNYSGGIQGGVSNGENIIFRVAFKPPSTIGKSRETTDMGGNTINLSAKGRHDPCVVNRAVPIVESMAALVLIDAILLQKRNTNVWL